MQAATFEIVKFKSGQPAFFVLFQAFFVKLSSTLISKFLAAVKT